MNTRSIAFAGFKALTLSVLAFSAQAASFTNNGGFEFNGGNGQVGSVTTLTGWTLPAPSDSYTFVFDMNADTTGANGQYGGLSLWGPGNGSANGLAVSPDGGYYVAMDSAFQNNGPLAQTITGLTAGSTYTVGFYYAGAQQKGEDGATTDYWKVGFGTQYQNTDTLNIASLGFSGWNYASLAFVANASSEVLSFLAIGSGVHPFALLDGVTVNFTPTSTPTSTPIPGAIFFVAPALAGVFGFSRRKQNKA